MKKIVLIFERSYFYQHSIKQSEILDLQKAGFEIELWSLAEWTFSWKESKSVINSFEGAVINIGDKETFDIHFNRVKGQFAVFIIYPYHGYSVVSYYIRKSISVSKLSFINITESPSGPDRPLPACTGIGLYYSVFVSTLKVILKTLKYTIQTLINVRNRPQCLDRLKLHIAKFLGPIRYKSLYNVITTKMAYYGMPSILERGSKRNIIANSRDYSLYLEEKEGEDKSPLINDEKYIVFIDQGLTQYLKLPGQKGFVSNEKKYWKEVNRFLDRVEQKFQCKVVIAVHPKAEYQNGEYGVRKLIAGETMNLIKYSYFNIFMFSTAFNYVILYKKPFMQITSDEILADGNFAKSLSKFYQSFVNMFENRVVNLSKIDDIELKDYVCEYDELKYNYYSNKFLIDNAGIADKTLSEINLDLIKKAFDISEENQRNQTVNNKEGYWGR